MTTHAKNSSHSLREAISADIPVLARYHRLMFEEIRDAEHEPVDPERKAAVEKAYAGKPHREHKTGTCTARVVGQGSLIVASGAMSRLQNVPVPGDTGCTAALLHSVDTETGHRHQGCAGMVVRAFLRRCREEVIQPVQLVPSGAGQRLYTTNGFFLVPDMMKANLFKIP